MEMLSLIHLNKKVFMSKLIFSSNRLFTIFDFFISHSQLLIRSSKNDDYDKNIDIIFFDVKFQQINTYFKGFKLRMGDKEIFSKKYPSVKEYLSSNENNLFEIDANNEIYYIAASFAKVYENELAFNETSLGVLNYQGRDVEITNSMK